ncbi:MAG: MFS transporter [Alphaproteobacteria bacterium]|nr:MFS transporter [Alphaproteobacteria bacterium]
MRIKIYKFYAYDFFQAFVLLYPVYALMFKEDGITDIEISLLFTAWSGAVLVFYPVYMKLSNHFSQKSIAVFGDVLKTLCFVCWLLIPNFWGYLLGWILWGFRHCISKLAYECMLFNEINHYNRKRIYTKVWGYKTSFFYAGYLLSCFGSLLVVWGYQLITVLSIASCLIATLILVSIDFKHNDVYKPKPIVRTISNKLSIMRRHPRTTFNALALAFFIGLTYVDGYFGLVGDEIGIPTKFIGGIFIAVLAVQVVFSRLAHRFEKLPERKVYAWMIASSAIFALVTPFYNMSGIAILLVFYMVYSVIEVLLFTRLQKGVRTQAQRTTFLSMFLLLSQVAFILSYLAMIAGVAIGGLRYGFVIIAVLVAVLGMTGFFGRFKRRA